MADMPTAKIRGIPMGLVEIRGEAIGEDRLTSPVTHTPCFCYEAFVKKWMPDEKPQWHTIMSDTRAVKFYLQDETGKVLVDPDKAGLDLTTTVEGRELNILNRSEQALSSLLSKVGLVEKSNPPSANWATDEELKSYMASRGRGPFVYAGGQFSFSEYCLLAGHRYLITGTCVENPNPKNEHDRNMVVRGQEDPTFTITEKSEEERLGSIHTVAIFLMFLGGAICIFIFGLFVAIILNRSGWL